MADDVREKGLECFEDVMGFRPPVIPNDPFLDTTIDHLFAKVWARPGLSIRDRRLVTLTVLMQFGNEATLKLHFGAAMKQKQLTDAEIDELIFQVTAYAGGPAGLSARRAIKEVRAEREAGA